MFQACYQDVSLIKVIFKMVFFNNESFRTMEIVAEVIEIEGNCLQVAWIPRIDGF